MGNCLWKEVQSPNQPAGVVPSSISLPSSGVNGVRISPAGEISKADGERNSSVPSKGQTEKPSKDGGLSFSPILEDRPLQDVRKDAEVHALKLQIFSYNLLKSSTQKFSSKNLIGQGGFGDVYRGWINYSTMIATKPGKGLAIAVKKLRKEGVQGHKEWLNELTFLSQFNHPNVVKLIGYCSDDDDRILVYEYMAKGSLEAYLMRESSFPLSWNRRVKVAVGAARGLAYLHTAAKPVIHRDLKASNILLDSDFNAKLSDFGLAKFGPQGDKSHVSTRILGTRGYFAPEYIATGHLTLRTDVYSFGVVLLEIFSGCGAIKKYSDGVAGDLALWAQPYLGNKLELPRIIDKKIRYSFPIEEAYVFASVICQCLETKHKSRPTMTEVVASLEQLQQNMNLM
ncbi:hypothetical protein HHK36_015303 [Tetracentron sinense]|uniref:non-specific serine/threonine protein kinase n=1 Tax=Tetracentron sinense TaxID=13715 RepID=A0A835DCP3_TETSI|nr:hypothetical protein HHK36_015303 [Tetracentron sinense]